MNKLPILFIHSSNELYGSDRVLLQLVSGLDRQRFEPVVVLPNDINYEGELSQALDELDICNYSISLGVLRRKYFSLIGIIQFAYNFFRGIHALWEIAKQHKILLIHSNTSAVFGGGLAAFLLQVHHVRHVHEIHKKPEWLGRVITSASCLGAQTVVAISSAVADNIPSYICGRLTLQIIWNGVDVDLFNPEISGETIRREWCINANTIVIGVVGRLSHWKGQNLLLEAARHLEFHNHSIIFVIVGDPPSEDNDTLPGLKKQASDLGLEDKTKFIPFDARMPEIMRVIDVLVIPSTLPEPFGLVALEAMASERPVIAAKHGGLTDIVIDGQTGVFFRPNDAGSLSEAMHRLIIDPELRVKMGKQGRSRVVENFSLEKFQQQFEHLFSELLSK